MKYIISAAVTFKSVGSLKTYKATMVCIDELIWYPVGTVKYITQCYSQRTNQQKWCLIGYQNVQVQSWSSQKYARWRCFQCKKENTWRNSPCLLSRKRQETSNARGSRGIRRKFNIGRFWFSNLVASSIYLPKLHEWNLIFTRQPYMLTSQV